MLFSSSLVPVGTARACVQVLSKALEVWGLTCDNLRSEENRESAAHPEREEAFICNLKVPQQPLPLAQPGGVPPAVL